MVKTADGYKAIARIRAGDRVFAKDEASGETGYKPVTAQYGNPYQETVYIEVSDGLGKIQTLVSNRIHPFYSDGKWIKAEDLKAGSRLFAENGAEQTVQSVTVKLEPLQAYNLTVADWHTYFVKGDKAETEGVWVHNECPYGKSPRKIDAVINIHVNPEILMQRLTGRFICRNCGATYHKINKPTKVEGTCDRCGEHDFYQREDDKPETVENRIQINIEQSKPILNYYNAKEVLHNVDGESGIDHLFNTIQSIMGEPHQA